MEISVNETLQIGLYTFHLNYMQNYQYAPGLPDLFYDNDNFKYL